MTIEWELIEQDHDGWLYRAEVPGGWIYKQVDQVPTTSKDGGTDYYGFSSAMCFVPRPPDEGIIGIEKG